MTHHEIAGGTAMSQHSFAAVPTLAKPCAGRLGLPGSAQGNPLAAVHRAVVSDAGLRAGVFSLNFPAAQCLTNPARPGFFLRWRL
jgi:hypothetical protein